MFARDECIVACLSETQSLPTVTFKEGLGKNRQRDLKGRETSSAAHLYNPPATCWALTAPPIMVLHTQVLIMCVNFCSPRARRGAGSWPIRGALQHAPARSTVKDFGLSSDLAALTTGPGSSLPCSCRARPDGI